MVVARPAAQRLYCPTMRCDPWYLLLFRLAFCFGLGPVALHQATAWTPWHHHTDGWGMVVGIGLLLVGLWHVIAYFGSRIRVDQAAGRLFLRRLSLWQAGEPEELSFALADIAAVVLMPQRRGQVIPPILIELRLAGGERVKVGTIASAFGGLDRHAERLAALIGCPVQRPNDPPT